ncbi:MAG: diguanylate cyclase [Burkholderiaceae bacterium]
MSSASHCVLFIDLDGFKLVNDSYGHSVGDQLLIHTAARIGTCLQPGDLLARQGGDEFIVIGADASVAERIRTVLVPPFRDRPWHRALGGSGEAGGQIFVSASIGVVTDLVGIDSEQAAQRADIAMYKAKEAGKARAIVFSHDMLDGAPERLALEADSRRALARDEFTVVYQPKVGFSQRGHRAWKRWSAGFTRPVALSVPMCSFRLRKNRAWSMSWAGRCCKRRAPMRFAGRTRGWSLP